MLGQRIDDSQESVDFDGRVLMALPRALRICATILELCSLERGYRYFSKGVAVKEARKLRRFVTTSLTDYDQAWRCDPSFSNAVMASSVPPPRW